MEQVNDQAVQETKFAVVSIDEQMLITITITHRSHNDPVEQLRYEIGEWLNTDAGNDAWQYSLAGSIEEISLISHHRL